MNRRVLWLIAMLAVCNIGKAQVLIALVLGDKLNSEKLEFGLNAGLQSSTISNLEGDFARNLALGLYFNIKLSEKFILHPEANMISRGGISGLSPYPIGDPDLDVVFANSHIDRLLAYFSLPVMARYTPHPSFGVDVGGYASLLTSAKDKFEVETDQVEDLSFKNDITEQYNRIDAGVAAGLIYRFQKGKGVGISLRYIHGLANIVKDTSGGPQRNRMLLLKAEIPIKGNPKSNENDN